MLRLLFHDALGEGDDRFDGEERSEKCPGTSDSATLFEMFEGVERSEDLGVVDEVSDPLHQLIEVQACRGKVCRLEDDEAEAHGQRAGVDGANGDPVLDCSCSGHRGLVRRRDLGGKIDADHAVAPGRRGGQEGFLKCAGGWSRGLGEDVAGCAASPELVSREGRPVDELL